MSIMTIVGFLTEEKPMEEEGGEEGEGLEEEGLGGLLTHKRRDSF